MVKTALGQGAMVGAPPLRSRATTGQWSGAAERFHTEEEEVTMRRKILASLAMTGALLCTTLTSAASAAPLPDVGAAESDKAVASGPPSDATCLVSFMANSCFKKYGDSWYLRDLEWDGMDVYADWQNQLRNAGRDWVSYRSGRCTSELGSGDWGRCNKDFYEDSAHNAKGGYGSRVRWRACRDQPLSPDTCGSGATWVKNDG
ncbi:hypothetical protein [Streptomyces sp. NPDC001889]